jgi:CubicO group peptidase (beta-lactamase class C family)
MSELQEKIQSILNEAIENGTERGAQAVIYYKGQQIVDVFAGVANPATGQLVTGDTLFPIFSTGKGITSTVIHRLVEQAAFNYDTPLAKYWPEFAAHGKEGITVRHVLSHTSGLPYLPLGLDFQKVIDWDYMCQALADSELFYPVGAQVSYHAITYGWLLGEFARRVTGKNFADLTQQEICDPLGINTLFFGVPCELEPFVAVLEDDYRPEDDTEPSEGETPRGVPLWMFPLGNWLNTPEGRMTCLPASNGIANARAIARHYAALVPGGVDGVELLPPTRVQLARKSEDIPLAEGVPRFGLGYGVSDTYFGHRGHGGSLGLVDPEAGWAIGFTRNLFASGTTSDNIIEAVQQYAETVK